MPVPAVQSLLGEHVKEALSDYDPQNNPKTTSQMAFPFSVTQKTRAFAFNYNRNAEAWTRRLTAPAARLLQATEQITRW